MNNRTAFIAPLTAKEKILYLLFIISMLALVGFCLFHVKYFTIDIFQRVLNGSLYVEASKLGYFILINIPSLLILIIMAILMAIGRLKKSFAHKLGKVFISLTFISILVTIIMWPVINHQLEKHNYSYCFHYTGSNMFSPPVYVKHPSYCHKGARGITKELFAWFDQQEAAGVEVQPIEVLKKIQELKQEKGTDW